jgi:Zn-dependent M28 family amino/carboxypeptidase
MKFSNNIVIFLLNLVLFLHFLSISACSFTVKGEKFNGERAYKDLAYQVSLGPRYPNSQGNYHAIKWISEILIGEGWTVTLQKSISLGVPFNNIIAKKGNGDPLIIIGAHFDTRRFADNDPDPQKHTRAVPGANDGASGVAILLELARIIPENLGKEVWLVFFDAEDNGGIDGLDWALGSQYFVENLQRNPGAVVILDMVGDKNLNIFIERSSDQELVAEIWGVAEELGHVEFINQPKYHLIDDHTAFLLEGISAVDIIDFDYPYWHTVEDTLDKVSSSSLQIVGETIFTWLVSK